MDTTYVGKTEKFIVYFVDTVVGELTLPMTVSGVSFVLTDSTGQLAYSAPPSRIVEQRTGVYRLDYVIAVPPGEYDATWHATRVEDGLSVVSYAHFAVLTLGATPPGTTWLTPEEASTETGVLNLQPEDVAAAARWVANRTGLRFSVPLLRTLLATRQGRGDVLALRQATAYRAARLHELANPLAAPDDVEAGEDSYLADVVATARTLSSIERLSAISDVSGTSLSFASAAAANSTGEYVELDENDPYTRVAVGWLSRLSQYQRRITVETVARLRPSLSDLGGPGHLRALRAAMRTESGRRR